MRLDASEKALIIDDGGLTALLATLLAPDPGRVVLWTPPMDGAKVEETFALVRRKGETLGCETAECGGRADNPGGRFHVARMLLSACEVALKARCGVVVWPANRGDRVDDMAAMADRARLVGFLADLETSGAGPRLETPFLDMTDAQVLMLAEDADAPSGEGWLTDEEAARWAEAAKAPRPVESARGRGYGFAGLARRLRAGLGGA